MTSALDVLDHSVVDEDVLPLEEEGDFIQQMYVGSQHACMYITNMHV